MTKNYSNQRRDGIQPSSRNSASGNYREEQSSRPARPRLSRDAVDRAWENGATRTYADYRPRQHPPTSPAQRQGRPAPARQPQNRRPYESSQNTYGAPRQGRYQQNQQAENGQYRPNPNRPGYRAPGGQTNLNSERWTRDAAPQGPGNDDERRAPRFPHNRPDPNGRENYRPARGQYNNAQPGYREDHQPPRFQQHNPNPNYREDYQPARFQRDDSRSPYRGSRQARPFEQTNRDREQGARGRRNGPNGDRNNYNPRWQSRPGPQRAFADQQRDTYATSRNDYPHELPGRAQFEGDYERFTDYNHVERFEQTERPAPTYERPVTERPVTRLSDGRVLKGSRPSQRKQARFWNGVEEQTNDLLPHTSFPQEHVESAPEQTETQAPPVSKPARSKKPGESRTRAVKTVKTARAKVAKPQSEKVARKNARGPQKSVSSPSQRGYKWPATGE